MSRLQGQMTEADRKRQEGKHVGSYRLHFSLHHSPGRSPTLGIIYDDFQDPCIIHVVSSLTVVS